MPRSLAFGKISWASNCTALVCPCPDRSRPKRHDRRTVGLVLGSALTTRDKEPARIAWPAASPTAARSRGESRCVDYGLGKVANDTRAQLRTSRIFTFYRAGWTDQFPRQQALFLHALLRVLRPEAPVRDRLPTRRFTAFDLPACARRRRSACCSFDIDPASEEIAQRSFGRDTRFTFTKLRAPQTLPAYQSRSAPLAQSLVFLNSARGLVLNQGAFERLLWLMAPTAILTVHDTGTDYSHISFSRRTHGPPTRWTE